MGGFAIRGGTGGGSRLGLYTNETLVDSADPIKLIATNPSHPIFAGVSLDGMNTMVNNYATIPSLPHAPNTLQRGISVGTPIAVGGQILGTVAAGDATAGGTVIALFPPGTTMASNPTSVSAGHKLIFLSGSREAANQMIPAPGPTGTNAETSGIYDLTDDGTRMFLNAVNFMLAVPEPSTGNVAALRRWQVLACCGSDSCFAVRYLDLGRVRKCRTIATRGASEFITLRSGHRGRDVA